MGQTRKRNYDRYSLAYKLQAVKLANHPDVRSKDVAESLGIHPVMLYRWQTGAPTRGAQGEQAHEIVTAIPGTSRQESGSCKRSRGEAGGG
ncbi:transposase [Alcanivorax sp. DSM 26293]|uniref:transposase n=1 Tax=Alcanivorax sp. DSM 26293 TaxID=1798238 RepID=UPI000CDE68BB|nr:transposase [Alcanivorax sp. DSM 26293]